ncbi:ATP-binding protein [Thiomicrorhabdus indica]|uniref:ATP-binding protein n=1 Tax=Thiomicrorhabdus indica TaxID=2267253 RepID=UPI00102DA09F|nr:ATP-binding protein [Thiomicrorhabdus indica]
MSHSLTKHRKTLDYPSISKQLRLVYIVFAMGFGSLALINYLNSYYQENLDKQLENVQAKRVLGSEVINHISQLERIYYRITTQINPLARKLSQDEAFEHVAKIYQLLDVFEKGGDFQQTLILNLPEHDNVTKTWHYEPIQTQTFDVLKIGLLPKLKTVEEKFRELDRQMAVADDLYQQKSPILADHMSKVQSIIKNTLPLFIRLLEETNRVQFEQRQNQQALTEQVLTQKRYFEWGSYSATLFLFILTILAVRVISRHITEMAVDLNDKKNQALEATKSKSVFLANMSHEIRTPLNAITGFLGLLKQEETNPEKIKYLTTIEESSHSLVGIINDILDFSKIESNKLEIDKIDFNPHTAFNSVADLFRARCLEKKLKLNVTIAKDIPDSLHSDPLRIKQVLTNLLSNAVKFTQSHHSIYLDIDYEHEKKQLVFSVKDEGIGITPEQKKKIFQPFAQAENDTTRKFGGTGLGLTISRMLVELLDGELSVESELGAGSQFKFRIPASIGKTVSKQKSIDSVQKSQQRHGKLLLVEDNKTNQLLMSAILKKQGIDFDLAEDGLQAIKAVNRQTYDLVLMDENMPNMSGSEATQKIREMEAQTKSRRLPIVALTANAMKDDRERFLAVGMDDYLNKPLNLSELHRILDSYL